MKSFVATILIFTAYSLSTYATPRAYYHALVIKTAMESETLLDSFHTYEAIKSVTYKAHENAPEVTVNTSDTGYDHDPLTCQRIVKIEVDDTDVWNPTFSHNRGSWIDFLENTQNRFECLQYCSAVWYASN